ncbi:MAG: nucleoside deaminase [Sedimentisphaerales bacterium]|nr:nucleoside deaminase [Sedimentisphaerales bacterium]
MCDEKLILPLPDWVEPFLRKQDSVFVNPEDKMRFAIELSRLNVEYKTGGPFGAAVFELDSGKVIAVGVNIVIDTNCSLAHAEMMAIGLAQQKFRTFDLGVENIPACELVTSTEPCAMCLGALPWSGVRRLICGARGRDACDIGFDEGAKVPDWIDALENRGIIVLQDVLRKEARDILIKYKESGGLIYNGRQATSSQGQPN